MIGQDFQDKLDAIVEDLQTKGKGQSVEVMLRGIDNTTNIFPLSSDANGIVNAAQLDALRDFITDLKPLADAYETEYAPVKVALDAFKTAQQPHEGLMTAATNARKALSDALAADANYQAAKTALDNARNDADYIAAAEAYKGSNVSENFGNLSDAKGKYVV